MARLETKTDKDIVHHLVSGDLTVSELVEMIVKYNEAPGEKTIWEISDSTPIDFKPTPILNGIEHASPYIRRNPGRRTAWLGTNPMTFGTARMLLTWSAEAAPEIEFQAFKNLSDALSWLNTSPGKTDPTT